jgi:hypothetical protein
MKHLLLLCCGLLVACIASAQPEKMRPSKAAIGDSGCSIYWFTQPSSPEPDVVFSADSSKMYLWEDSIDTDYTFGLILIRYSEPLENNKETKEQMMTAYLDYLQEQLGITGAAGYGMGHTLEDYPNVIGLIDYWEDVDEVRYAVKAWSDSNFMAVLYISGPDDYPVFNIQDMFLNGIRFPK